MMRLFLLATSPFSPVNHPCVAEDLDEATGECECPVIDAAVWVLA
jgi:hypothetical protein